MLSLSQTQATVDTSEKESLQPKASFVRLKDIQITQAPLYNISSIINQQTELL